MYVCRFIQLAFAGNSMCMKALSSVKVRRDFPFQRRYSLQSYTNSLKRSRMSLGRQLTSFVIFLFSTYSNNLIYEYVHACTSQTSVYAFRSVKVHRTFCFLKTQSRQKHSSIRIISGQRPEDIKISAAHR